MQNYIIIYLWCFQEIYEMDFTACFSFLASCQEI